MHVKLFQINKTQCFELSTKSLNTIVVFFPHKLKIQRSEESTWFPNCIGLHIHYNLCNAALQLYIALLVFQSSFLINISTYLQLTYPLITHTHIYTHNAVHVYVSYLHREIFRRRNTKFTHIVLPVSTLLKPFHLWTKNSTCFNHYFLPKDIASKFYRLRCVGHHVQLFITGGQL